MKNSNKKLLFERMHKIAGMPLNEIHGETKRESYAISLLYEGLQTLLYDVDREFLNKNFTADEIQAMNNIFKKIEEPLTSVSDWYGQ